MKLLKKEIAAKDGSGSVILKCEEPEDMYTLYNLIAEGDCIRTLTSRKVYLTTPLWPSGLRKNWFERSLSVCRLLKRAGVKSDKPLVSSLS